MQKILIADSSEVLVQALTDQLKKEYDIRSCLNGRLALTAICDFQPDLLILNMVLPEVDGAHVLKLVRASGLDTPVLILTPNISPYVQELAARYHVDHAMTVPCNIHLLVNRAREILLNNYGSADIQQILQQNVTELLIGLGFPQNRRGTKLLINIIPAFAKDPTLSLTKNLYCDAARSLGGNSVQVERAVRKVIEDTWKRADRNVWRLFFPPDKSGHIPKPTNGEFISALAEALKNSVEKL